MIQLRKMCFTVFMEFIKKKKKSSAFQADISCLSINMPCHFWNSHCTWGDGLGLASIPEDLWESREPCKVQVEAGKGCPDHLHWHLLSIYL